MSNARLSIFSRFKTGKQQLTGEARRQRSIIAILAEKTNPSDRTRTSIAQHMADAENTVWKNIYSGIFRDLDEVLLPMDVVREEGRLPLRRGPKALQELGVPYYGLTRQGMLVALPLVPGHGRRSALLGALSEGSEDPAERRFMGILGTLSESSPLLFSHIMTLYVGAFCDGRMDSLLPFDPARLPGVRDGTILVQREAVAAYAEFTERERGDVAELLDEMIRDGEGGGGDADVKGVSDGNQRDDYREDGDHKGTPPDQGS